MKNPKIIKIIIKNAFARPKWWNLLEKQRTLQAKIVTLNRQPVSTQNSLLKNQNRILRTCSKLQNWHYHKLPNFSINSKACSWTTSLLLVSFNILTTAWQSDSISMGIEGCNSENLIPSYIAMTSAWIAEWLRQCLEAICLMWPRWSLQTRAT